MKLRQKLLLAALPAMLGGIIVLGVLSYLHSRDLVYEYEQQQATHVVKQFLDDFIKRRQRLLQRTDTASIESFVERYQMEALREIGSVASEVGRRVSVFDLSDGSVILRTGVSEADSPGPRVLLNAAHEWRIARASRTEPSTGIFEDTPYAAVKDEVWNWALVIAVDPNLIHDEISKIGRNTIIVTLISALITTLIFNWISRRAIIDPVQNLKLAAVRIAQGETVEQIPIDSSDEIGELARSLERMVEELSRAVEEAKAADRSKSAFLANMSHEIRTPMNGILGMAQLLNETRLEADQKNYVRMILRSGTQLKTIIDDILDLSKLDAAQVEIESLPVDLNTLVEQVASHFSLDATSKGNRIVTLLPAGEPTWVLTDPTRLQQCLMNLIGNANKFTSGGTIEIALHCAAQATGRIEVAIAVKDSGIGISEAAQSQLFERFMQSDSSTTRRFGGTGLGLSIVKELATLMGGSIEVESREGQGSTFTLRFQWESVRPAQPEAKDEPKSRVPDLGGARVLVAEDNQINQILIRQLLKKCGIDCIVVENGASAVEALKTERYDLVLMDIQMPVLDGIEATREIRAGAAGQGDIPIVALTANVMADDRKLYLSEGFSAIVAKPIEIEEFYGCLAGLIGSDAEPLGPRAPQAATG